MADFLVAHGAALLFYLFAALAVAGAVMVVVQRNPMYGAMSLLVTFLAVAALFLLRQAEFVAVVQVFVYGGGIMVLFLFVIMLVNLHQLRRSPLFGPYALAGVAVVVLLALMLGWIFLSIPFETPDSSPAQFVEVEGERLGNSQALAWKLYRDYFLPFEVASLFLLVAMIGAVVLGRRV